MGLEVALLEWREGAQGLRLVGRSADPAMVAAVKEHLVERLAGTGAPDEPPMLRLVRPADDDDRNSGVESTNDE